VIAKTFGEAFYSRVKVKWIRNNIEELIISHVSHSNEKKYLYDYTIEKGIK
jgi:hypothetical protein